MPAWIEVFGRLHPLALHLPVGLLIGLGVYEGVAASRRAPPAPRLWVALAALGAVGAAATGWVLHQEPDYEGGILEWHERLGIATAVASVLVLVLRAREKTVAYRVALALALGLLLPAGHFGATMTHGEGFLTAPLRERAEPAEPVLPPPSEAQEPATPTATLASYREHVAPIFASRCNSCHGETKKKGGLRLDGPEWIARGGKGGDALVAGTPADSELLIRMRLPLDDEDRMPPEHKKQPAEGEIALIEAWIAAGASYDAPFALAAGVTLPAPPPAPPAGPEVLAPAPIAALEAMRARLVHVQPVAADAAELWVDFAAPAAGIGDAEAAELLGPLTEHVAELNLSRTQISDATLKRVARMPRLRRLELRATGVTDAGLNELAGHEALAELVLTQTRLTDAAAEIISQLPELRKVWLWQSGLSADAIARLRAARPDVAVDAGELASAAALEAEGELQFSSDAPSVDAPPPAAAGAASLTPVNATCPVSGNPVNPKYAVVFEGRVIGFCCPNCPKDFWADPERFRAALGN